MIRIMFICVGNTCRSQMAEGFARARYKSFMEAHSSGLKPEGVVNLNAIKVMGEIGIDISGQRSKLIDPVLLGKMDYVVTLCAEGEETCPVTPPGVKRIHMPIEDPALTAGTEKEIITAFRKARREIEEKVGALLLEILGR